MQALQRLAAVAVAAHDDDLKAFCMHELAKIVGCGCVAVHPSSQEYWSAGRSQQHDRHLRTFSGCVQYAPRYWCGGAEGVRAVMHAGALRACPL